MDRDSRKRKLGEIKSSAPEMTGVRVLYKGEIKEFDAFQIPLEYLIYNKLNGRISSAVKSYEKQYWELDAEKIEDQKTIEKFLWDSKPDRNNTTMVSLIKDHQQRYGIVTADGIIIDGNRRAFLLNKIWRERENKKISVEHCQYFIAIILPEDASEKEVMALETKYQMGEDEKLDYNPIEKYLKCYDLKKLGFSEDDIATMMGEKSSQIKKWISILNLMDDYLENYNYEGIYTRLDEREDQFISLHDYINKYNAGNIHMDWTYEDTDINDLKVICFDYIRAKYEGKDFRNIGQASKKNKGSLFSCGEIWQKFTQEHFNKLRDVTEDSIEKIRQSNPDGDLSILLSERDKIWTDKIKDILEHNLMYFTRKLEDMQDSDQPLVLIQKAFETLNLIDTDVESFYKEDAVLEQIKEVSKLCWDFQQIIKNKRKTSN